MKILRIIARLNVGGPARHVVWLTKELQNEDFQTTLIAGTVPDGEADMAYFAAENGVEPLYLREMSRELSLKDLMSILKIYGHIRRESPGIVHTHTAKAGTVGRTAALLYRWFTWRTLFGKPRKIRTVHTFHGHVFHSYYGNRKTRIFIAIEKLLARLATDRIVVISPRQLKEIRDEFGVGRISQFRVIPLGIDLESFDGQPNDRQAVRNEFGAKESDIVVGFVGRLTEIKDLPHLLKVAAMYNDSSLSAKPSLKFVIIGDGALQEPLRSAASRLGLDGVLTFLGNRTDTTKLYSGLDIVALTSMNEGTPLSLIEGMAAGRAVISTVVGGVGDLLGDVLEERDGYQIRNRGVGVETRSVEAFLNGLLYLAENKKERESFGLSGRRFVEQQYDKKRLIADIKDLYNELI